MTNDALPIVDLDSPGHEVVLWTPRDPVVVEAEIVETKPARRARKTVVAKPKPPRRPTLSRWTFKKNGHTWCKGCRCIIRIGRCANLQCGNYWEPGSVTRRTKTLGEPK